ncbi:Pimeloyl-ACP methyl ester carboxylesterase [Rhodococcus jostii]|uniref:Pimeloyl-ACP methyl ester carboxylesterase n=1 Tax=Rhodococcus jostii TaxID=132919 RepID=A0A1H5LXG3_RHOJO|nr:Pimeloyl-ACP methyl ester carboxylesterase [Rhodococcus jostii]
MLHLHDAASTTGQTTNGRAGHVGAAVQGVQPRALAGGARLSGHNLHTRDHRRLGTRPRSVLGFRGEASSCEERASSYELTFITGARRVEHRFVDVGCGVTIHVADAGLADGSPVMLVHGFPQNWWAWHELIGPLAADGYRVLCPDLRGAGWSSAPDDRYSKTDMADDLAVVLDRLGVASVRVVAHDWGGPIAGNLMLRHPKKVSGFFGLNTVGPWLTFDLTAVRHLWRFWYQIPISLPVIGPRLLSDPKGRFIRMTGRWVGAGFYLDDDDFGLYVRRMREPGHAVAGSRWYRTFLTRELIRAGEFANTSVDVPIRFLHGVGDPVITPTLLRGYGERARGFQLETVDGVGHWIVDQRPELVLERLRAFLQDT